MAANPEGSNPFDRKIGLGPSAGGIDKSLIITNIIALEVYFVHFNRIVHVQTKLPAPYCLNSCCHGKP